MTTGLLDQRDDPFAALAAVDRAPEIDRIAQNNRVAFVEFAGEGFRKFVAHLPERTVAMRLEEREYAARMRFQGAQCSGTFFGIVAEVVDHRNGRGAGADDVEAAREASTGNVSLGNTSFENSSVLTRQFAQGTIAPSFTYGAAQTRTFSDTGSMTTSFPEASYDQLPNSSYPFTPSLGQEFTSRLSTMASRARSNSESYANIASESTTSAVTKFRELRSQFSRGSAFESATGTSNSDSIQTAFNEVDQASTNLQRQFGLSRRAADDISTAWFLGGEAGAKAGVTNGVLSANVGAKAGGTRTWTDSDIGISSEDRSRIFGSLAQMSDSRNWSSTRDGFVRSVSTSSSSSISSTASGMNASLTEAQSYSREARRAEELANRLESQASFFTGNSAAGSLNLSQAYREWGLVEIERNRDFYGNVRFDDLTFQLSPEGQALQGKFIESYAEQLRDGIEDREYIYRLKQLTAKLTEKNKSTDAVKVLLSKGKELAQVPDDLIETQFKMTHDVGKLLKRRAEIADMIEQLQSALVDNP